MKKGYRYNSTIQFSTYMRNTAQFGLGQEAMQLGQQAWGLAKQVPGQVGAGAMNMLRKTGNTIGGAVQNPGMKLWNYGDDLAKAGQQGGNAFQMAAGQGMQKVGGAADAAGQFLQKNAAATGGVALGAGALGAGAGANALMNRNKQPGMQQPGMY